MFLNCCVIQSRAASILAMRGKRDSCIQCVCMRK